jgi:hypothetical protein
MVLNALFYFKLIRERNVCRRKERIPDLAKSLVYCKAKRINTLILTILMYISFSRQIPRLLCYEVYRNYLKISITERKELNPRWDC